MDPALVSPGAWTNIQILINDTAWGYSVIFGIFETNACLGMRWNGNVNQRGYPGQGPYPLWFVLPDPFQKSILDELTIMSKTNPNIDVDVLQQAKDSLL